MYDIYDQVAIKMLDLSKIVDYHLSTGWTLGSLNHSCHPNLINVRKVFRDDTRAYFVVDFVDGISLTQFLELQVTGKSIHFST